MTRVMALWSPLAGYSAACLRALQDTGTDVRVLYKAASALAPYDEEQLAAGLDARRWAGTIDDAVVREELDRFEPHVILVTSWNTGAYRRQVRPWAGRAIRVLCMDNQWLGTPRQWAGRALRSRIIQPSYDAAFVAGERQATFAKRLGIGASELLWGYYACEPRFFTGPLREDVTGFVFVGRLVEDKGIDVLADAYRRYRGASADPWPLRVIGTGPGRREFDGIDGVDLAGFVAPEELSDMLQSSRCLVLPSRFEPWGLVVQEAAASGLSLICTDVCGSSTRFALDGYNGRVVPPDDARSLAQAMAWVASRTPAELARQSEASAALALQLTSARWASYLLERTAELAAAKV